MINHERGGPDCSQACDASDVAHVDDPPRGGPAVCPRCGGNGHACYPTCREGRITNGAWY